MKKHDIGHPIWFCRMITCFGLGSVVGGTIWLCCGDINGIAPILTGLYMAIVGGVFWVKILKEEEESDQ